MTMLQKMKEKKKQLSKVLSGQHSSNKKHKGEKLQPKKQDNVNLKSKTRKRKKHTVNREDTETFPVTQTPIDRSTDRQLKKQKSPTTLKSSGLKMFKDSGKLSNDRLCFVRRDKHQPIDINSPEMEGESVSKAKKRKQNNILHEDVKHMKKFKHNDHEDLPVQRTKKPKKDGVINNGNVSPHPKTKLAGIASRNNDGLQPKRDRTVFVGNLPCQTDKKELKAFFQCCGTIKSLRLRGGVGRQGGAIGKKIATITKEFNKNLKAIYGYVEFKSQSGASNACKMNGSEFNGHKLRIDTCGTERERNVKYTVFLGNLPYDVTDDAIREYFEKCGQIVYIRVIRDRETGLSKGFGYIQFTDSSGFCLALKLHATSFQGRGLRVIAANTNTATKGFKETGFTKQKSKLSKRVIKRMEKMKKKSKKEKMPTERKGKVKITGIAKPSNRVKSSFPMKTKKMKLKQKSKHEIKQPKKTKKPQNIQGPKSLESKVWHK